MFSRANARAVSIPDSWRLCARSARTRFHNRLGPVVVPTPATILAIIVCSAVRVVLLTLPSDFTWLKSVAYCWLVSDGGAAGTNCCDPSRPKDITSG